MTAAREAIHVDTVDAWASAFPALIELAVRVGSWEQGPTRWSGGRAAHVLLPPDVSAATGLRVLKLKGLGVAPAPGVPAAPPRDEIYDRWPGQTPDAHFGIRSDTEFGLFDGDPAPVGGLSLRGARRELECAAALVGHGVASVVPVAVLAYDERALTVGGVSEPLGIAVTGSRSTQIERCSATLPGWPLDPERRQAEQRRMRSALGCPTDATGVAAELDLLGAAYRQFGVALRGFAAAGLYRYSGHADNFAIADDGRAVMIDLDSSRRADPRRPDLAALEAVRDGMSGLYNLACAFFRPSVLAAVPDEVLAAHQPFSAFLDGWDPGSAGGNAQAGRALADYVIVSRQRLRHFGSFLQADTPAAEHLYRYVRHDRDLTFSWLYRQLFRRRLARPTGGPMPFGVDELDARLLRFAGRPRMGRLLDLEVAITPEGIR